MPQLTTAGRLLVQLYNDSECLGDSVANASGILLERAHAAAIGAVRLTLSEQLRLSEAVAELAPNLTRQALRLRGQVLAARSYEDGDVQLHLEGHSDRWERSTQLRR
ncbi:MAG TPA: hypothetical protein VGM82_21685 [Gemmatimonadaceae bacterium]